MPDASELEALSGKMSAQSYTWANACYGVNVTGADIETKTGVCAVPTGLSAGWVAPGEELSLEVPRGVGRKIEVYAHFRNSPSDTCPLPSMGLNQLNPSKMVRIGDATFDAIEPVVNVSVRVTMPANGIDAISQLGLAASCKPAVATAGSARITPGRAVVANGIYKMDGVISSGGGVKVLSGGIYKVQLSRRAE